ncbi:hypothetical protein UPYG_G00340050 [Umbra pygmaea]|uniref:Uncharacterized protein n=1 Tax=Umbra pygmaea TaxID=75934 RepID=A0ABD0VXY8_UMBPY
MTRDHGDRRNYVMKQLKRVERKHREETLQSSHRSPESRPGHSSSNQGDPVCCLAETDPSSPTCPITHTIHQSLNQSIVCITDQQLKTNSYSPC